MPKKCLIREVPILLAKQDLQNNFFLYLLWDNNYLVTNLYVLCPEKDFDRYLDIYDY